MNFLYAYKRVYIFDRQGTANVCVTLIWKVKNLLESTQTYLRTDQKIDYSTVILNGIS